MVRRRRSNTPTPRGRSSTPDSRHNRSLTPNPPYQRSKISSKHQFEPLPEESASQAGSRRSDFLPRGDRGGSGFDNFGMEGSSRNVHMVGGGTGSDMGTAMALLGGLSTFNNPLLSQILMEANRPKFQGTAEHFSEFRRLWGD